MAVTLLGNVRGPRGYSGLVPRVNIPWSSNITVQCGDMSEIATLAGATTVTFGAEVPGYDAEWDFVVRQGSTAYQLTLPAIEWGFGSAPTFAANTSTVCRVYKSDGVFCGEWSCRRTQ